jgi:DNA-binding MarR family transcriptional regulator
MPSVESPSRAAVDAWRRVGELVDLERCRTATVARELDLSAAQLLALRALKPEQPLPMGRLAGALECDKGNVTGIVDRLERRGLVERRPVDHDRRIKVLALTDEGVRLQVEIEERLQTPPAAFVAAGGDDLERIAAVLDAVVAELREAREPGAGCDAE